MRPAIKRCRSCNARVLWLHTGGSKATAFDVKPIADGTYIREGDSAYRYLPLLHQGQRRYQLHRETCVLGACFGEC